MENLDEKRKEWAWIRDRREKLLRRKAEAEKLFCQMRKDFMFRKIYSDVPLFSYLERVEQELEALEKRMWYAEGEYAVDNPFLK